ncbi:hypothetical protein BS47DRAFT_1351890 [Hydnum rufescens UP504]|uniref:Uncharacterized protein n=1 Tax=Hydnum rufescens UP504 TaxID=1448309 RepID=A0A9P6AKJ8_9AGAM|nr:hypothetical protein BS47DRAFT_1351890 [Hydnum rufescens UP504]
MDQFFQDPLESISSDHQLPSNLKWGSTDDYSNFGAEPSLSYGHHHHYHHLRRHHSSLGNFPMSNSTALRTRLAIFWPKIFCQNTIIIINDPNPMYLPPALGTTEAPTYAHNSDIEEGDKDTDLLQFADFGTIAGTSGHATHSVATTLASASNLKLEEAPTHKGKPQGKEPQSRRLPKVKGGQHPGPQPTGKKPRRPRTKLHGEEADIARHIARQLLAEVERCDEHHLPERLDRRARPPDRVTTDMALIPDNLNHVRSTLEAHMGAVGNRPLGLFAMRVREPRRWKVTRPNGVVVVVREAE